MCYKCWGFVFLRGLDSSVGLSFIYCGCRQTKKYGELSKVEVSDAYFSYT